MVRDGFIGSVSRGGDVVNGELVLYLLRTDEAYFRYHGSLRRQDDIDGNPFAEPAPLYGNVTGGLGVFAAYVQTRVAVPL